MKDLLLIFAVFIMCLSCSRKEPLADSSRSTSTNNAMPAARYTDAIASPTVSSPNYITISGSVADDTGLMVTGANITLKPLECTTFSSPEGTFIFNDVAVTNIALLPAVFHPDYGYYELHDYTLIPTNGDIIVSLVIPTPAKINGIVLFKNSRQPVTNARVWIEATSRKNRNDIGSFLKKGLIKVPASHKRTLADGTFSIAGIPSHTPFIVACTPDMYPSGHAGPFTDAESVPNWVEIIIPDEGSRIVGRFTDAENNPVTNVLAKRTVQISRNNNNFTVQTETPIHLSIDDTGDYMSELLNPGLYTVTFSSDRHLSEQRKVTLGKNSLEFLDIVFKYGRSGVAITGIVVDVETAIPVPDASITIKYGINNTGPKETMYTNTDSSGSFVIQCFNTVLASVSHPDYMQEKIYFKAYQCENCVTVSLFKSSPVYIHIRDSSGKPCSWDNLWMYTGTSGTQLSQIKKLSEGEYVTYAIPPDSKKYYVALQTRTYQKVCQSSYFTVTPGIENHVNVTIPDFGSLHCIFSAPIDVCSTHLNLRKINNTNPILPFDFYKTVADSLDVNYLEEGTYRLTCTPGICSPSSTNITITADETTFVHITVATQYIASIHGKVITPDGQPLRVGAKIKNIHSSATIPCGEFLFNYLDPQQEYDVSIDVLLITNIVLSGVKPSTNDIIIVVDNVFKLTGRLVDRSGKPLNGTVRIPGSSYFTTTALQDGEFLLSAGSGAFSLLFEIPDYNDFSTNVVVRNEDVDLGEIIISDKGRSITGTVFLPDNTPADDCQVFLYLGRNTFRGVWTDTNGRFVFKNMPDTVEFTLKALQSTNTCTSVIPARTGDIDVGEYTLE